MKISQSKTIQPCSYLGHPLACKMIHHSKRNKEDRARYTIIMDGHYLYIPRSALKNSCRFLALF